MPIHNETSSLPVSGRFDFNRLIAQHLRRYKATSLLQLTYEQELEIKYSALERYFEQHRLPGKVEPVIASPMPRYYRTTSKRRIEVHQGRITAELDHIELDALPEQAHLALLEPEAHRQIYALLLGFLEKPAYREFAKHVNFLIIRGTYEQHSVIFNVDQFDAEVVRKGKLLAEHLQESAIPILSSFMFLDPSRSDYYFESRRPDAPLLFKKLFGPDMLSIEFEGKRFFYEPTGFSQVNLSMVPELIRVVKSLLPGDQGGMLIDLYCGYGLFGLNMVENFAGVVGLDAAPGAIRAAAQNHKHLLPEANVVLAPAAIDGRSLRRLLPESTELKEYVILDPPRQGTNRGVIETLAGRKPAAVVHIFCGMEQIPREVPNWLHAGYRLDRIVPLDLFPGTANLETCLLFTPRPEAPPQVEDREVKRKTPYTPSGDRPYKRREERPAGDRPARPFRRSEDKPGSDRPSSDRPYKRRSEERPAGDRPARPFRRSEDKPGSDRPSSDRPYKRRSEERPAGDRPARPFRRSEDRPGSDRPSSDRPYKRREDKPAGDRPARPFRRSEDKPGSDRPSSDRPYKRRSEDRPAGERPARPFRRSEDKPGSDRPSSDRPYKRRSEERPAGDRPARPSRSHPPDSSRPSPGRTDRTGKPASPSRSHPTRTTRTGKPGAGKKSYGKRGPGKPLDSKRSFGKKSPAK